jgi:hypothetical protein
MVVHACLTPISEVLSQTSDTKEIMWNFSLFKDERRLTLKDNPHFYENLPVSAGEYEGRFRADPIETFHHDKISVLTDNPGLTGRVFLETAKEKRAFGNVWVPREAIIFKGSYHSCIPFLALTSDILLDVNGKLEGEGIVGKAIQKTSDLWCFEEPLLSNASWSSLSNRSSPSPTMSASPTASPTGSLIEDWREPILRMLRSQDVNIKIRISDKLPTTSSQGESLGVHARLEGTISSPASNAGIPPSGLRVTITSPLQKLSTIKPPAATNVAGHVRHVPSQFPGPSFAHEVATVVPPDPGAPPPLDQAQSGAPTALAQTLKENWIQKYIWDYKK